MNVAEALPNLLIVMNWFPEPGMAINVPDLEAAINALDAALDNAQALLQEEIDEENIDTELQLRQRVLTLVTAQMNTTMDDFPGLSEEQRTDIRELAFGTLRTWGMSQLGFPEEEEEEDEEEEEQEAEPAQ